MTCQADVPLYETAHILIRAVDGDDVVSAVAIEVTDPCGGGLERPPIDHLPGADATTGANPPAVG